jgi:hypothetical protein
MEAPGAVLRPSGRSLELHDPKVPVDASQHSSRPTTRGNGEAAQMQLWFDDAMCKNMEIPDGYRNVAVLIIKWTKTLDSLKCDAEVSVPFFLKRASRQCVPGR